MVSEMCENSSGVRVPASSSRKWKCTHCKLIACSVCQRELFFVPNQCHECRKLDLVEWICIELSQFEKKFITDQVISRDSLYGKFIYQPKLVTLHELRFMITNNQLLISEAIHDALNR
jgi:hypothetical protein